MQVAVAFANAPCSLALREDVIEPPRLVCSPRAQRCQARNHFRRLRYLSELVEVLQRRHTDIC